MIHTGREYQAVEFTPAELGDIESVPVPPHNKQYRREILQDMQSEGEDENRVWRGGVRSFDDAAALLRGGWQEGADRALLLGERLQAAMPDPVTRKRQRRFSDRGDEFCTDRYYARWDASTCWEERHRAIRLGTGALLTVAMQWGGNGGLSAKQMFWSGASAVALTDALEAAGYTLQVLLIDHVRWPQQEKDQFGVIRAKDPGDTLLPSSLAALAAHAGIYRSLRLAMSNLVEWDCTSGCGTARNLDSALPLLIADRIIDPVQIVIPKIRDEGHALAFLSAAVADVDAANIEALEVR